MLKHLWQNCAARKQLSFRILFYILLSKGLTFGRERGYASGMATTHVFEQAGNKSLSEGMLRKETQGVPIRIQTIQALRRGGRGCTGMKWRVKDSGLCSSLLSGGQGTSAGCPTMLCQWGWIPCLGRQLVFFKGCRDKYWLGNSSQLTQGGTVEEWEFSSAWLSVGHRRKKARR